jgi:hypothetical protein
MQTPKTKLILLFLGFILTFSVFAALPAREVLAAGPCDKKNPTSTSLNRCLNENPIVKDLRIVVRVLSAGTGVIIVGSIIWAGVKYVWAGNNPNEISAAKDRIQNSIIALLAFFFIFAFLEWLIPGGLLFNL